MTQPPWAAIWADANQRYLWTELAWLRTRLEHHQDWRHGHDHPDGDERGALEERDRAEQALPAPSALRKLINGFHLSDFERQTLLLCAGAELDSRFGKLNAEAQGDERRTYPTFSLALSALDDPHWSALLPRAPLRRWRFIEVGEGSTLTLAPLRLDERVVHYLVGLDSIDESLAGIVRPVTGPIALTDTHRQTAVTATEVWRSFVDREDERRNAGALDVMPVIELCGDDAHAITCIAQTLAGGVDMELMRVAVEQLPATPSDIDLFIRLWEREAVLGRRALLLDAYESDGLDAARTTALQQVLERTDAPLILSSRSRRALRGRNLVSFDVQPPDMAEQRRLWQIALERAFGRAGGEEALVSQFNLGTAAIQAAVTEAKGRPEGIDAVWDACRMLARPRIEELAQRIEPRAEWENLIVPEPQKAVLKEILDQVRGRARVYDTWGFAERESRGLGVSVLFVGTSGTGKTLAAETIACALRLDLYRIDLSQVVSKYIGETEKNLRRVFDAAEEGGAVLLFDEADALFGKRSDVKDSHDRYANIEVSYLLQRMESYRGLAILTTNMKGALDPAFLRRLRFVVQFPFPDASQRAQIWRKAFTAKTPLDNLDFDRLAQLNIPGGNIRNIALHAAFLAANDPDKSAVTMTHLLHATRSEYTKMERPVTDAEIGGWL